MVLQNIVFPDKECREQELYYRVSGQIEMRDNSLCLGEGTVLSTDTYMNLFDKATWDVYTCHGCDYLEIEIQGKGCLELYAGMESGTPVTAEEFDSDSFEKKLLRLYDGTKYYFRIVSQGCRIKSGAYVSDTVFPKGQEVVLALVICTYKRETELKKSIYTLMQTDFWNDKDKEYAGKLFIYIIDNASRLSFDGDERIFLFHNPNTGGSGGFSRGIRECIRSEEEKGITHVIFMDDDALIHEETFYRLYALLKTMKPEYCNSVIGGRMFCMDKKNIQYTAGEIWNRGNIRHVGGLIDMAQRKCLYALNDQRGEYTGWWFGCFPMTFVKYNLPLPFFLHCDDVEYGLRYGKSPIVLNGIQVWHEVAANRRRPLIAYYDIRNTFIVNTMYVSGWNRGEMLIKWVKTVLYYHFKDTKEFEYTAILALDDYLDGCDIFLDTRKYEQIPSVQCYTRSLVLLKAGIVLLKFLVKGKRAFLSFRSMNPEKYSREMLLKCHVVYGENKDEDSKYNFSEEGDM